MASPIEQLPVELMDMITSHLAIADCGALRLASRRLRSASLIDFFQRFFANVSTSITPASLSRLVDMSADKMLAKSVRTLHIKWAGGGLHETPPIHEDFQFVKDTANNKHLQSIISPLACALASFSNLDSIRFFLRGQRIGSIRSIYKSDIVNFQANCFKTILDAVIQSGIRLQGFSTLSAEDTVSFDCAIVPHQAFNLPLPYLVALGVAFANLKTLAISINEYCSAKSRVPGWENGISQFVSTAPSLEKLSLDLGKGYPEPFHSVAIIRSLAQSTLLPKLECFQLYGGAFEEQDLAAFTFRHMTSLRRLTLQRTRIARGSCKSLLAGFRDSLNLEYLEVEALMEGRTLLTLNPPPPYNR